MIYKFKNKTEKAKIFVSSIDNSIDFVKHSTKIIVYIDDLKEPEFYLFAETYILDTNQKQTNCLEIPVYGNEIKVEIKVLTQYDINKLIVELKS